MAASSVELIPLENLTLRVAKLSTEHVPQCFHCLLELLLFNPEEWKREQLEEDGEDEGERFMCMTALDSGVTLIASSQELARFPKDLLHVNKEEWRPVRVGEGAHGFETVGVVERIAGPLAAAGIPLLYVSTHAADYVLIPVHQVVEALDRFNRYAEEASLQHRLSREELPMERAVGDDWRDANSDADGGSGDGGSGDGGSGVGDGDGNGDGAAEGGEGKQHSHPLRHSHPLMVFEAEEARIEVVRLERSQRQKHAAFLLRLLLLPRPGDTICTIGASVCDDGDEISILASSTEWFRDYCRLVDDNSVSKPGKGWVPIRVGGAEGTDIGETGVVATQAKVLAAANVPLLYLSTYRSDFTLVAEDCLQRAIEAFEKHGMTIEHCEGAWGQYT